MYKHFRLTTRDVVSSVDLLRERERERKREREKERERERER